MNNKLSRILIANAIFSSLCAIDLIIFHQWIGELIGLQASGYLQLLGAGLVIFAAFVYWVSRAVEKTHWVKSVIYMDRSWVVGSALVLMIYSDYLSNWGVAIVILVALIVGIFAEMQNYYCKKLERTIGEVQTSAL